MNWIWCCVALGLCSLWTYTCAVSNKRVDLVIESGCWHSRRESGKERVGEREKKGKERESGLREKECLFAFV